jgi:hypothetical protein
MSTVDDVWDTALTLPAEQRAALARDLLLSLEDEAVDPEVEREWLELARQRAKAYDRGETTAHDWRDAIESIRQSLAQRRRK